VFRDGSAPALTWGEHGPQCGSDKVARHGHDERQRNRQCYRCPACQARFDDLTGTIFAGHHQPLRLWIRCLYFMGLNLSNQPIAQELDLNIGDVLDMTEQLCTEILTARPTEVLEGVVECDEVHVTAGHKGQPTAVAKKAGRGGTAVL
jgi:transposase-like protein